MRTGSYAPAKMNTQLQSGLSCTINLFYVFVLFFNLVGNFLLKLMPPIAGLCLVSLLYGNFSELTGFALTYWQNEEGNLSACT